MKSILKRISLTIAIIYLFCNVTAAQDQSRTPEKSEVTIELSYYKKADLPSGLAGIRKTVAAIIKKTENGKYVFANNAKVNFYVQHDKEQQLLNSVITDNHGQAVILIQKDLPLDDSLYFTIVAKIENDPLYVDAQEQIHYKDANLTLHMDPLDTAKLVTAKVTETGKDGKEVPVINAEVKFYVQRLFGFMPAAEENTVTTDEKGEASFAVPKNISGDTAGLITIGVRLEDNELFGNLENTTTQSWGTVLPIDKNPFPRALFEPQAPLPLVITVSTLFGGIWVVFFFIFYQLRKIKKEEKLITKNEIIT